MHVATQQSDIVRNLPVLLHCAADLATLHRLFGGEAVVDSALAYITAVKEENSQHATQA